MALVAGANANDPANASDAANATTVTAWRIVGGQPASQAYSFMASLHVNSAHWCGGSLVGPYKVLTAAHCVHGRTASDFRVYIGLYDLDDAEDASYASVTQIEEHPQYDETTYDLDVAVLHLSGGSDSTPIALVSNQSYYDHPTAVTTMGWGTLSFGGTSPRILQQVQITIDPSCGTYGAADITSAMVCAGGPGRDSCQGDSGGPLLRESTMGPELLGVVSWGYGCATDGYPGVYARVDRVLEWMNATQVRPQPPPQAPTPPPPPTPPPRPPMPPRLPYAEGCNDDCNYAVDDECDDGGDGSEFTVCSLGSDCVDCGARTLPPKPPPPSSPPPSSTCSDKKPPKWCLKRSQKGRCRRRMVAKRCRASCNPFVIDDKKGAEWCADRIERCGGGKMEKWCARTCWPCAIDHVPPSMPLVQPQSLTALADNGQTRTIAAIIAGLSSACTVAILLGAYVEWQRRRAAAAAATEPPASGHGTAAARAATVVGAAA